MLDTRHPICTQTKSRESRKTKPKYKILLLVAKEASQKCTHAWDRVTEGTLNPKP